MSDPTALVPVPFYPPVRPDAGNADAFTNLSQRARRIPHVARQVQSATPEGEARPVYDQRGLWVRESQLGWIVNIWV